MRSTRRAAPRAAGIACEGRERVSFCFCLGKKTVLYWVCAVTFPLVIFQRPAPQPRPDRVHTHATGTGKLSAHRPQACASILTPRVCEHACAPLLSLAQLREPLLSLSVPVREEQRSALHTPAFPLGHEPGKQGYQIAGSVSTSGLPVGGRCYGRESLLPAPPPPRAICSCPPRRAVRACPALALASSTATLP
jgi:hypothetical protein